MLHVFHMPVLVLSICHHHVLTTHKRTCVAVFVTFGLGSLQVLSDSLLKCMFGSCALVILCVTVPLYLCD